MMELFKVGQYCMAQSDKLELQTAKPCIMLHTCLKLCSDHDIRWSPGEAAAPVGNNGA